MRKILIASDHAGFPGKEAIKQMFDRLGVTYEDFGTDGGEISVDYPDYAERLANAIVAGHADQGILVCGSGIGMQIAANKVPGIRAALAWNEETARLARAHNNANILTIGYRTTQPETIDQIVRTFISTDFEGGRHERRIEKISSIEEKNGEEKNGEEKNGDPRGAHPIS